MIDGYRKVALQLHAMDADDRRWMLQQFGAEEVVRLTGLLRELQELGFKGDLPVSAGLSEADARELLLEGAGVDRYETEKALEALLAADAAKVSALLCGEPDTMLAVVLSTYPWPWRARLLAEYGVEERLRVNRALAQTQALRPKVRAELIGAMAKRLSTMKAEAFPVAQHVREDQARMALSSRRWPLWHGLKRWLP